MTQRRLTLSFALLALCLGLTFAASASAQEYQDSKNYSHARIVRLSLVEGDVQVLRPEAEEWEQALLNLPIQQGYTLASGRGRAEIELESGATIRIAEDTVLEFTEMALADGARITRLALKQGTATFYANLSRHDVFTVTTPYLSVAIPDNARFRLDALQTGTTVSVLKGDVQVEAAGSTYKLTKGRSLVFQEGATEQVTLARNAEPDEFDRWVADRDEVITTATSQARRYVNSPYSYGLADLTSYGLWYHDARFGYVWQPWGLYSGWSPYFQGRWVFIHGYGWTWVSYEPWGWVPYHYGRWVLSHRGWVWVPGGWHHGWHPGLVAWVTFGDRIGWCPLGPRDRVGATFGNPQGGVVITNTPGGVVGGTPNGTTNVNPTNPLQFIARAPLPDRSGRGRSFEADADGRPSRPPREVTAGAETPATGGAVAGASGLQPNGTTTATPRSTPRGETGIVYDPHDRRFVNNPRRPANPRAEDVPAGRTPSSTGPARPQVAPNESGAPPRTSDTPARPSWGSRPEEPRTPPRPTYTPPPRTETPRPTYTPPPRTETPRPTYTPPPRTETPRPTYTPPPRAETPRPTYNPPPRTETPRPSPPPQQQQQQPRGESKPQKP